MMAGAQTLRVAVGGGHGFIGGRVCAALREAGHEALPFGREGAPTQACDALVWAGGGRSGDAHALTEAHVAAPLRALLALRPRRVVYLSSAEVYGRIPAPFAEDDVAAPESVYGNVKQAGELTLAVACRALGSALVVLRPTVVYGPGQAPTMLLSSALAALRAGQTFAATAGTQTRDFVYVDDLAALVLRCLADDAPAGTYNAGTGAERPVREVLLQLARAIGPEAEAAVQLGALPTREGETMRYAVDMGRVVAVLGWRASTSLDEGLRRLTSSAG